jgi:cyclic pyranopterin phosphate synthase
MPVGVLRLKTTPADHRPIVDSFGREFRYLRISVTDRCNLRCTYCMPAAGVPLLRHEDILTYEEIAAVARAAVALGVTSVRITGGEPLVRRDLVRLVKLLRGIAALDDISMTTNALLLPSVAASLARAGLNRVNVSIDSLEPQEYAEITRGGDLHAALAGVEAALGAGLEPVKMNAVTAVPRDDDGLRRWAGLFVDLARRLPVHVRFIELMPTGIMGAAACANGLAEIIRALGATPATGEIPGAGPARYWRLEGALGLLGLIAPMSEPFCDRCNRLRLTARGELRSCLFSAPELDLMPVLRPKVDAAAISDALFRAWRGKRRARGSSVVGAADRASMCQIGG